MQARLTAHCTRPEDAARMVERRMRKSEAALLLGPCLGRTCDALVSGRSESDTWVRIFAPPVKGRWAGRLPALDVGRQLRVRLVSTDVQRGFIDFVLAA